MVWAVVNVRQTEAVFDALSHQIRVDFIDVIVGIESFGNASLIGDQNEQVSRLVQLL